MLERWRPQGFLRAQDGSAAVEFAFVAVPFVGLLLVLIETGIVFLFGLSIDNAAQQVARLIQTGQLQQAGVMSAQDLKNRYLCAPTGTRLLPSIVPCDRIAIDIRTAQTFDTANVARNFYQNASASRFCPGDSSSIVVVRIAFALPVFLPPIVLFANRSFGQNTAGLVDDFPDTSGWNHLIASAYVVQNEPSGGAGSNASGCS